MAFALNGFYGYTIQGVMHAQSIDNQKYIIGLLGPGGFHPSRPLDVNRGGANLVTDQNNPAPGRSRETKEMPVQTAFYSLNYPSANFSDPPPSAPPHLPPPDPPSPEGFTPVRDSPSYSPNTGYYPFSEAGLMFFTTSSFGLFFGGAKGGLVEGRLRINTAGYGGTGNGANFHGSYKFDQVAGQFFPNLPSGFITIQLDTLLDHVWDYAFVQISQEELLLTAVGRVPRPGVGTGTMKRISRSIFSLGHF